MKATQTGIESNKTGAYGQQPSLELLKSKYTHEVNLIWEQYFLQDLLQLLIKKQLILFGSIKSKCLSTSLIIKYLALCCQIRRDNTVFCQDFNLHFTAAIVSEEQYQMLTNVCHEVVPWPSSPFHSLFSRTCQVTETEEVFGHRSKFISGMDASPHLLDLKPVDHLSSFATINYISLTNPWNCHILKLLPGLKKISKWRCTWSFRSCYINLFTK